MYIEGKFRKLAKICVLLAAILCVWAILVFVFVLTDKHYRVNIFGFLMVFLPVASLPAIFGILAFSLRRITREIAEEQRAMADAIRDLDRKIRALDQ